MSDFIHVANVYLLHTIASLGLHKIQPRHVLVFRGVPWLGGKFSCLFYPLLQNHMVKAVKFNCLFKLDYGLLPNSITSLPALWLLSQFKRDFSWTCFVEEAGLKLINMSACSSWVLGINGMQLDPLALSL